MPRLYVHAHVFLTLVRRNFEDRYHYAEMREGDLASEAQRGYALDVPAQAYKMA